MSVFVKSLSDLAALFLRALRLSVIIPSFILVGLNITFVVPSLENTRLYQTIETRSASFPLSVIVVFVVLLSGYVLATLNTPIIRFFEGYSLLPSRLGRRLQRSNHLRVLHLRQRIQDLDQEVKQHQASLRSPPDDEDSRRDSEIEMRESELMRNAFNNELCWMYPHHQTWRILPTRLGNVIAAAEEYPGRLYGIDSVTFWPLLAPILEETGYASFVENEKSLLDFLLNMAVVTLFFGAELAYLGAIHSGLLWAPSWQNLQAWLPSLAKMTAAVVLAFCFYLLSIRGALTWGYSIRAAFVLHKEDLRKRLGLMRPESYYQERNLWKDASTFFRDHDVTPGRWVFDFASEESDLTIEVKEDRKC
jgi:hypothetical protein